MVGAVVAELQLERLSPEGQPRIWLPRQMPKIGAFADETAQPIRPGTARLRIAPAVGEERCRGASVETAAAGVFAGTHPTAQPSDE